MSAGSILYNQTKNLEIMLVKFTTKGKPTLVSVNHIVGVRKDTEQRSGDYMTKIFLSTSLLVFVDEDLDEVHKLINDALNGTHIPSYDYEVPSVDERFQAQYNNDVLPSQYDNNRRGRPQNPRYNNNRYPQDSYNNRY
jgi:hypothetical protein